jgi:hypothetical protein
MDRINFDEELSGDEMLARFLVLVGGGTIEQARAFIALEKAGDPESLAKAAQEVSSVFGR